jgi:hypothetical protein
MCLPTCARVVCLALTRAMSADRCRYSRASRSLGTPSFQDQPVGWSGTGHTTGKHNFVRTLNGEAHSALQKTVPCGPITSLIRWAQQSIGAVDEGRESEGVESGACRAYSLLAFDHAQCFAPFVPKTAWPKNKATEIIAYPQLLDGLANHPWTGLDRFHDARRHRQLLGHRRRRRRAL